MQISKDFFKGPGIKRILILLFFIALLFALRSILHLILITFILTYLVDRLHMFIHKGINKYVKINYKVTVLCLYAALLLMMAWGTYNYLPKIITQINQLVNVVVHFYNVTYINYDNDIMEYIMDSLQKIDLASYLNKGFDFLVKSITDLSQWGTRFIIAFILSLFFVLEKKRVKEFTMNFKTSKIAPIYSELEYFGNKFLYSFGKVIEVQFLIALINCILSTLFLWMMGFPQLFGLAIMIFLLGLIPVMGVIISLIPLCAIAFSIGGVVKVVYVIVMICVVHAIEAYILNPKLMSSKIHLPIFYTFAILIVSQHFLGVWGLILGVPIFMFLLDLLEVDVKAGNKIK
ncbi:AI-2E family transporter [Paenibacillus profundus]|uniref:AI-2E family transporter n=1 Tax=Paenibacillus profundus TaxID=1173085 RepID=A0ABS8YGP7_9BACL|nr:MULTISPECIES: AI-2E family transporter [Paenibacillus]MCE5171155.1 AI-2E family transporter [Paenibacillus profundus]MCM3340017.1 AI-2E family transporter [Paenibacillus sp. MER TA 81-3]